MRSGPFTGQFMILAVHGAPPATRGSLKDESQNANNPRRSKGRRPKRLDRTMVE
jgi:hypothetical protein